MLQATDKANSIVQFTGDVTLNGLPWQDPGAGEFRVVDTARLLGDYASGLPTGYRLVVTQRSQFNLTASTYTNNGTIELRGGWGFCYVVDCEWEPGNLNLAGSTSLLGNGLVEATGAGGQILGPGGATLQVGEQQTLRLYGSVGLAVVNEGLVEVSVGQLTVTGAVTNSGTLRATTGGNLRLHGGLVNSGTVEANATGTMVISGTVTNASEATAATGGRLRFSNATVWNTGQTITADGGVVEIANSTMSGGVLQVTDKANSIVQFTGDVTLNEVPWEDPGAGEFRVVDTARLLGDYASGLPTGYRLVVTQRSQFNLTASTYTNNGTIELRGGWGFCYVVDCEWEPGNLNLAGSTSLLGNGLVEATGVGGQILGPGGATLQVGEQQTLRLYGSVGVAVVNEGLVEVSGGQLTVTGAVTNSGTLRATTGGSLRLHGGLVNSGTVEATSGQLTVTGTVTNTGTLQAADGGALTIQSSVTNGGSVSASTGGAVYLNDQLLVTGSGSVRGQPSGTIALRSNLLGDTRNADLYAPVGAVVFRGPGSETSPQHLEVMSQDRGVTQHGLDRNFAYDRLSLGNTTYVQLVDQSDNAQGSEPEALYIGTLSVPPGTTLDLNGLHLYARAASIGGHVIGGSVAMIHDAGPIRFDTYTPGAVSSPGEIDVWTFFGRAGRSVTVAVNPGGGGQPIAIPPYLGFTEVVLVSPSGSALATASSGSDGQPVTLNGGLLPTDGTYRIEVRAQASHPSNTGNYLVSCWDATPDVGTLVLNQQSAGQIENPYSIDRWDFSAPAGQQIKFDLLTTSDSGVVFDLVGPSDWSGFSDLATDSDLVTLPESGNYTLIARGSDDRYGVAYAFRMLETVQLDLILDAPYDGTFVGSGQAQLFRLSVPASISVQLALETAAPGANAELYMKFGIPPTRADFDYGASSPATADQQILVPMAAAGIWYILVYGDFVPFATPYSLLATASGMLIDHITPDHHGTNADAVLTVTGAGFDRTTTVELVALAGSSFPAGQVALDSFTQITATFAAGTVPAGIYAVRLAQLDGDVAHLPTAFQMTTGGQSRLETDLIVPASVGLRTPATIYVEYANTGELAMPAPLLVLHGTGGALLSLDQSRLVAGVWTSAQPEAFSDTVQILACGDTAGVLQPGESVQVPVYFAGLTNWDGSPNVEFTLGVLSADDTTPVDWATLKDEMRPEWFNAEAWEPVWANFTSQVGATWGHYLHVLDDNATYLGRLGQRVIDVGSLLAFEFQQADGLGPMPTLASATDADVDAPVLSLSFGRVFAEPISRRYELGPLGRGWSHTWQMSLSQAADGTVTVVEPSGARRTFQPDN